MRRTKAKTNRKKYLKKHIPQLLIQRVAVVEGIAVAVAAVVIENIISITVDTQCPPTIGR